MKYMGSKKRIANYITQYINDIANTYDITEYYEPFMGGCSVGELVRIKNRHLSDINKHLVALFKRVQTGMWDFEYITREQWYKIKDDRFSNTEFPEWLTGWASVGCSFRGRPFEGYAGEYEDSITHKMVNPQIQVYNSLLLERDKLLGIDFQCKAYNELDNVHHSIIYCDAPYRGKTTYRNIGQFDFVSYDKWLVDISKDNLVFISEYSMKGNLEDNFIQLDEWTLNKSIGAGNTDSETSVEKLYYVKDGWLTKKLFEAEIEIF